MPTNAGSSCYNNAVGHGTGILMRLPSWVGVAVLVMAALILYLVTLQAALFNDGIFFVDRLEAGELLFNHLLYLPLVNLVQSWIQMITPVSAETTLKLVSALSGAMTLILVYQVARSMLRDLTAGNGPALVAAATLAVLPGYWFFATATELHAPLTLCTTLLFLGLLRAVDERRVQGVGDRLLQFLGAGLTPAAHASGIVTVLPAAYAASRGKPRRSVWSSLGLGYGLFLAVYLGFLLGSDALDHYQSRYGSAHLVVFTDPGRIPDMFMTSLSELLLYSAPASTLIPVGLRFLFPLAPGWGWLCLFWLLAWPLIAFPIADHAYGSYYLPTFPVQAVLAVLALLRLSRDWMTAVVVSVVAVLPGVVILAGDGWGLLAWWVCAACLFFGFGLRPSGTMRPSVLLGLPLVALLLSGIAYVPGFLEDPVRERIQAVQRLAQENARVIVLEADVGICRQWMRYFPGSRGRVLNPLLAELGDASAGERELAGYRAQVAENLASGREVWLVGPLEGWERARFVGRFLQHLRSRYRLEAPDRGPPDVRRVREVP